MNILTIYGPVGLFFAFAIMHALADFSLQSDYMARGKRRDQAANTEEWVIALTAHSLVHAGGVWLISGSVLLGAVELGLHWLIDLGKGEGKYGVSADQGLHLACKLGYVVALCFFPWG